MSGFRHISHETFLILFSRNLLSTLPKYLFDLPLKVLVLSNNKLVSIPEEIGKLKDLMELVSKIVTLIVYNMHNTYLYILSLIPLWNFTA